MLRESAAYPAGQGLGINGFGFDHGAAAAEGGKPFGLGLGALEFGQEDDGYGVGREVGGQLFEGFAAGFAGLAAGQVDFEQFEFGKQADAVGGGEEVLPVGGGVGGVGFAVQVALLFGGGTDGI